MSIVSILEADSFLVSKSDWAELSDSVKSENIKKAEVYILTNWESDSVDFSDEETINDGVKEACSLYAYASLHGNLFGDESSSFSRSVKREVRKTGPIYKEFEYFSGRDNGGSMGYLSYPDSLMIVGGCYKTLSELTRT